MMTIHNPALLSILLSFQSICAQSTSRRDRSTAATPPSSRAASARVYATSAPDARHAEAATRQAAESEELDGSGGGGVSVYYSPPRAVDASVQSFVGRVGAKGGGPWGVERCGKNARDARSVCGCLGALISRVRHA